MSLLFLDPGLLALLLGALVVCLLVWAGRLDAWLGRDAIWTVLVWPAPVATLLLPVVGAPLWAVARAMGVMDTAGGLAAGLIYLAIFGIAWVAVVVWPPAWLLPSWARARVMTTPSPRAAPRPDAVPALHVVRGRGHGSRARWAWRVDAVPGFLWQEGELLRFRALGELTEGDVRTWLDDALEGLDEPHGAPGGGEERSVDAPSPGNEIRLDAPEGGWWTRRSVDVDLTAVATWRVTATRPWSDAGLLELEIAGRGRLGLWVEDVRAIAVGGDRRRSER